LHFVLTVFFQIFVYECFSRLDHYNVAQSRLSRGDRQVEYSPLGCYSGAGGRSAAAVAALIPKIPNEPKTRRKPWEIAD